MSSAAAGPAAHHSPSGRPRSSAIDAAIARATMELLAEVGYEGLTIERVAERAGVGRSSLYRRYPAKADLVVATIAALPGHEAEDAAPAGQSTRDSLRAFLRRTAVTTSTPGYLATLSALASGRPADRALALAMRERVMGPRVREAARQLANGIAQGEIRPDAPIGAAITMLRGAVIARSIAGEGVDDAWFEDALAIVLDGIGSR